MLTNLKRLEDYQKDREAVFRSWQSLLWFVRSNKAELVERGALLMLLGTWHVDAEKFDGVVVDIAQRTAKKHLSSGG